MNVKFNDKALEELYVSGSTKDHKYKKLSQEVIKQFIKAVNYLKAARRIEDLYTIKSLHYEKKKGDLKGIEAEHCRCRPDAHAEVGGSVGQHLIATVQQFHTEPFHRTL